MTRSAINKEGRALDNRRQRFVEGMPFHDYKYPFPSRDDEEAGRRAYEALSEFAASLTGWPSCFEDRNNHVLDRLTLVAARYVQAKEFRQRLPLRQVKLEQKRLIKASDELEASLNSLTPFSRAALREALFSDLKLAEQIQAFGAFRNQLAKFSKIRTPEKSKSRGARPLDDVRLIFESLAELWQELTHQTKFKKTRDVARNKLGGHDFVAIGMVFVERLATAIDPEITRDNIVTVAKNQ